MRSDIGSGNDKETRAGSVAGCISGGKPGSGRMAPTLIGGDLLGASGQYGGGGSSGDAAHSAAYVHRMLRVHAALELLGGANNFMAEHSLGRGFTTVHFLIECPDSKPEGNRDR